MAQRKKASGTDKLAIAIVGCGNIARAHASAIGQLRGVELAACCDLDEARARALAQANDVDRVYSRLGDVLKEESIDAVALCLPHDLHCKAALAAARAGKHVLCEKPMAISLTEADQMLRAARRAKVTLMVGQILRFRKSYRTARDIIRSGRIGQPRHVIRRRTGVTMRDQRSWSTDPSSAGGWLLYGYGSHELDAILWLSDTSAQTVYAQARVVNPVWNDYDEMAILMSLADGSMASMSHSLNSNQSWWDQVVIGSEGSLYLDGRQVVLDEETITVTEGPSWGMVEQYQEFASAVREKREPEASGRDVRRTMVALEAAKLSIESGQPVDASNL